MTVDDCAAISEVVSALLDVEDPVRGAYSLEVSSPGLDRPLTRPKDFHRFAGFEVKVELARLVDGRRRLRGVLKGTRAGDDGPVALIDDDGREWAVPLAEIAAAKLVLTDALVQAAMKGTLPGALTGPGCDGQGDDEGEAAAAHAVAGNRGG
ncbi:MAG: ribosome maturation factor RimP [Alphaproteobacteria bacterium]